MTLSDLGIYLAVVVLVVGIVTIRRRMGARRRLRIGLVLFAAGWAGIVTALHFNQAPILKPAAIASGWAVTCGLFLVIGMLFLVTGSFDWWGPTRPHRQRFRFPPFD
jgi:hypothetical protein